MQDHLKMDHFVPFWSSPRTPIIRTKVILRISLSQGEGAGVDLVKTIYHDI